MTDDMRILQLGKFYPIRGGVEKVMRDLTEGISGRGIDCDMLCAMLPGEEIDPADRPLLLQEAGLRALLRLNRHGRICCVLAVTKLAGTMISPAMVRWLRRHRQDYDLIHVHHPDPMAALALYLSGYTGRVVLHWHADIVSQKALLWLFRPLQRWLLRRTETVVCTTPAYLEASEDLRPARHKGVSVPIGIHPLHPDPEAVTGLRARYAGKKIVLSIGRLVPYKGYTYLVQALAWLPEEYHLVIGGTGPLMDSLKQEASAAGLADRVDFLGYVPDAEMAAWFGACDVFVLPSVMKTEAFGIVQIEAMSCGCPVIATRIPGSGVSWVNADGVSGLNVPPRDPQALAQAIRRVCDDPSVRAGFGAGARARFDANFTMDQMIDKILKVYGKMDL